MRHVRDLLEGYRLEGAGGVAMANGTWKFVQTKSKHAMKQVLGIDNEDARMKVTPPLAVAPHAHGDDTRWNPNDDGINFNP